MSAAEYEEITPAPRWLRATGVCGLAAAAALAIIATRSAGSTPSGVAGFAVGIAVCALVGLLLISMRMRLRVTDGTLTLALDPLIRKHIPIATIASATVEDLRPWEVGGIGYRIAGRDRVFLFSRGPAVAITVQGSTRRYLWRTNTPDALLDTITSNRSNP